jgi:diguanylate cyclase (GGDEF)-like protein
MHPPIMLSDSKNKFQRGMIYLFALLGTIAVAPIGVMRFVHGEYLNAFIDLAIVVTALCGALYTYKLGRATQLVTNITAVFYSAGAVLVTHLNEPIFVFWVFPIIVANFLLLNTKVALAANLLAIVAILPIATKLHSNIEFVAMISSLLICGAMAQAFAILTHRQQLLLEGYATQDALTQLGNRRAMDAALTETINDYARNPLPATLVLLDLDFFKLVNDTYGHTTGDKVLVELADLLIMRMRKTDRVFRYGGEEFVILTRNTPLASATAIAEHLRQQIEANLKDPEGALTASFGCAELVPDETPESWLERADKALYLAKQQGRNCVVSTE